jgi:hypothetical protein
VQYNQPFDQASNPNAPYTNGNPATGTQGSIVPAAAVEYPQREIINAITDIGLATPTNSDLHQLSAATRFMRPQYLIDTGGINTMQIAMSPSPLLWAIPLCFFVLAANTTTTSTPVISIVGVGGSIPIVRRDNLPLFPGDIKSGSVYLMMFDGTSVRVVSFVPSDLPQVPLNSNLGIYVNGATGSDTLYDGTSPTISGIHGPFATIQRGLNQTSKYNLNGYTLTVNVAPWGSVYNGFDAPAVNGAGAISILGSHGTPSQCQIGRSGASTCHFGNNGAFVLDGFQVTCTGAPTIGDPGALVWVNNSGANVEVGSINCGTTGNAGAQPQIISQVGVIQVGGPDVILSGATAGAHWQSSNSGALVINAPSGTQLTINGPCSISTFMVAAGLGFINCPFSSITGAGNVTGSKYLATMNGVIGTGTGNINYLPGSTPGSTSNGGQYN